MQFFTHWKRPSQLVSKEAAIPFVHTVKKKTVLHMGEIPYPETGEGNWSGAGSGSLFSTVFVEHHISVLVAVHGSLKLESENIKKDHYSTVIQCEHQVQQSLLVYSKKTASITFHSTSSHLSNRLICFSQTFHICISNSPSIIWQSKTKVNIYSTSGNPKIIQCLLSSLLTVNCLSTYQWGDDAVCLLIYRIYSFMWLKRAPPPAEGASFSHAVNICNLFL